MSVIYLTSMIGYAGGDTAINGSGYRCLLVATMAVSILVENVARTSVEAQIALHARCRRGRKTTDSRIILCDAKRKAITESPRYGILSTKAASRIEPYGQDLRLDSFAERSAKAMTRKPDGTAATHLYCRFEISNAIKIWLIVCFLALKSSR